MKKEHKDLQSWLESLSENDFQKWFNIANSKTPSEDELCDMVLASVCIVANERGIPEGTLKFTQDQAQEWVERFVLNICIFKSCKEGTLKKVRGRYSLSNDSATFTMTAKGNNMVREMAG